MTEKNLLKIIAFCFLLFSVHTLNAQPLTLSHTSFVKFNQHKSKLERIKSGYYFSISRHLNQTSVPVSNSTQFFTAKQKLDTVKLIAKSYANDAQLKAIIMNELFNFFSDDDSVDGKSSLISYYFNSPTKGLFSVIYSSFYVFIDSNIISVPFPKATFTLNFDFVDTDIISDSAEFNGGTEYRYEPGTRTIIAYELRNYSDEDLYPPDTTNPYWKVSYIKTDFANQIRSVLNFYFDPYNGSLISKSLISFQAYTIKEKFGEVDSIANLYYPNSKLMYALGFEDYIVDGKSLFLSYGYLGQNNKKFSVNVIFGIPVMDDTSGWIFDDFQIDKPVLLNNYLDSDTLMRVSELNGGINFRDTLDIQSIGFFYIQSPIDTSRVLFHVTYTGLDTLTGYEKNLLNLIDPLTGALVSSIILKTETNGILPQKITLYQNYPNPFNSSTKIRYVLPKSSFVSLNIYDLNGRLVEKVFEGFQHSGNYEIQLNLNHLSSGVYFYSLKTSYAVLNRKMILVK